MITKGDKILVFFILITAFLIFAGFQVYSFAGSKTYVIIEQNGNMVQRVSLGKNNPKMHIRVPTELGENIVEIDGERVRMLTAHCADGDCVRQSFISKQGQVIVCLPNRIVIKIESDISVDDDIDAVSF